MRSGVKYVSPNLPRLPLQASFQQGLGNVGTSVLSGSSLLGPQRKGQKDTQVQILKLPLCAMAAGPERLLPRLPCLLSGTPCATVCSPKAAGPGPARGEATACQYAHTHRPQSNTSTPQQIWKCLSLSIRDTSAPLLIPWSRVVFMTPFPQNLCAHSCLATLTTRAHYVLARSKRSQATGLAVGALPSAVLASEGAHLEPALYPKTDLTQLPHGWLPGQILPPAATPGTGVPVPFSRRPQPTLGAPESPSCPRSSVHLQATPQVSQDLASELGQSVSETIFQDATVPALSSADPYLILQAWPSEEGGAVCSRLKDGLQLSVSSGQSHSM